MSTWIVCFLSFRLSPLETPFARVWSWSTSPVPSRPLLVRWFSVRPELRSSSLITTASGCCQCSVSRTSSLASSFSRPLSRRTVFSLWSLFFCNFLWVRFVGGERWSSLLICRARTKRSCLPRSSCSEHETISSTTWFRSFWTTVCMHPPQRCFRCWSSFWASLFTAESTRSCGIAWQSCTNRSCSEAWHQRMRWCDGMRWFCSATASLWARASRENFTRSRSSLNRYWCCVTMRVLMCGVLQSQVFCIWFVLWVIP